MEHGKGADNWDHYFGFDNSGDENFIYDHCMIHNEENLIVLSKTLNYF